MPGPKNAWDLLYFTDTLFHTQHTRMHWSHQLQHDMLHCSWAEVLTFTSHETSAPGHDQ